LRQEVLPLFREVQMVEVLEVRLWLKGHGYRRIAQLVQADRKTVRRYVEAAEGFGLRRSGGDEMLTDELLGAMAEQLQAGRPRHLVRGGLAAVGGGAAVPD
jgi:hypothetical protein